jgi:hypothetical protein
MAIDLSPENQLGPDFYVSDASQWGLGVEARGWVVKHRPSNTFIWTGGFMTLREAADRLLNNIGG